MTTPDPYGAPAGDPPAPPGALRWVRVASGVVGLPALTFVLQFGAVVLCLWLAAGGSGLENLGPLLLMFYGVLLSPFGAALAWSTAVAPGWRESAIAVAGAVLVSGMGAAVLVVAWFSFTRPNGGDMDPLPEAVTSSVLLAIVVSAPTYTVGCVIPLVLRWLLTFRPPEVAPGSGL
jgi:hypothetical protein